jgi:hypothetical protein
LDLAATKTIAMLEHLRECFPALGCRPYLVSLLITVSNKISLKWKGYAVLLESLVSA